MEKLNHIKSPIIGISATLLMIEEGRFLGRERTCVGHDYIKAIELAGGVPLVLPIINDSTKIEQQIELIDGLLLSGGYDVCPLRYDEDPCPHLEAICPERDAYEIELLNRAKLANKPILGICRGMQLINVALGGTLHQDLYLSMPHAIQHQSKAKPEDTTHHVSLVAGTKLQMLMNESMLATNSFHHQAIKKLARPLIINAFTKDGVVEGIESKEDAFILGVQWHPELMIRKHPDMLKLFQSFVQAAKIGNKFG